MILMQKTKTLFFTLLMGICTSLLPLSLAYSNALTGHSSPYLAMHGNDPVNWMEWGEAALQKARKENKLLFVSIGYYACHWCHVMHRESFSNDEIANKLNADYISIKVDRELSPVLDKRLIEFASATLGQAGWPLNVFITPSGDPLVAVTYIPQKSFSSALTGLSQQWKDDHKTLSADAKALNLKLNIALTGQEKPGTKKHIAENSEAFIKDIMDAADTLEGGLGEQTKFPSSPQLHALFELNKKRKKPEIDKFIRLTLDAMSQKGLHDELGGGFYRYTIDQGWNTPHYEKMLYNNALLPLLYFDAADYYQDDGYRQTALETLYFLQDAMQGKSGAFIASLSAVDNKGVEGGYYLWTLDELKNILNKQELQLATTAWEINSTSDGVLPMMQITMAELIKEMGLSEADTANQLKQLKSKLNKHRAKTRKIPRDHKLLTAWNGLALAAFARGIQNDKQLKARGQELANFLISMWNGKHLRRSAASNKAGTLNDYAAASWGLLSWAEATGSEPSRKMGVQLANYAWQHFYQNGKWLEAPKADAQLLPKGAKTTHITDEPYPSAETLLIRASFLAKTTDLKAKAHKVLSLSTKSIEYNPYSYASLIAAAEKFKGRE